MKQVVEGEEEKKDEEVEEEKEEDCQVASESSEVR